MHGTFPIPRPPTPAQPAGTGFSTGNQAGYAHNETTVGDDMYVFLQAFFQTFPQYQSNDFYITGESCTCAGCWQPAWCARSGCGVV